MNVIIKEIVILDKNSKIGKIQNFKKGINVVTSIKSEKGNYVGKSTLLKSIYHALGADVFFDVSKGWESSGKYYYILSFLINDIEYIIMRKDRFFILFDKKYNVLFKVINRDELAIKLAELFNMSIYLKKPKNDYKYTLATPVFMYCLSFLDQKKINGCSFDSFKSLSEYSDYYSDLIYSHLGIKDVNARKLEEEIKQATDNKKCFDNQKIIVSNMIEKIDKNEDINIVDSEETIRQQLNVYKNQYNDLSESLSSVKNKLYTLYNLQTKMLNYINDINDSLKENDKDEKIILKEHTCPLCTNKIKNYTEVFFKKVKSNEQLEFQIVDAQEELENIKRKIDVQLAHYDEYSNQIKKLEEKMFSTNSSLENIVTTVGMKKYKAKLVSELTELISKIDGLRNKIKELRKRQKKLNEKIKSINNTYTEIISSMILEYDISIINVPQKLTVDKPIECSDNYILTTLWLCALNRLKYRENIDGTFFPLILDNPNDRDFDKTNDKIILEMIFDNYKYNEQIIVSKVDIKEEFLELYKNSGVNINHINLTNDQFKLLNTVDYEKIMKKYKDLFLNLKGN